MPRHAPRIDDATGAANREIRTVARWTAPRAAHATDRYAAMLVASAMRASGT